MKLSKGWLRRLAPARIVRPSESETARAGDIRELDLVCAIWIFSCNDENSLITYKGIQHRLDLSEDYDVRSLVKKRPELFRPGANSDSVAAWKEEMLQGRRLPGWISAISSDQERQTTIRSITKDDVFRSQFRARRGADRSPMEIIQWGLDHIDRLRKARAEVKDASAKKWQMWLVFWVGVVGIASQFGLAFVPDKRSTQDTSQQSELRCTLVQK